MNKCQCKSGRNCIFLFYFIYFLLKHQHSRSSENIWRECRLHVVWLSVWKTKEIIQSNPTMLIISPLLSISSHPVLSGCSYSNLVFLITCYLLEWPVYPLQSVDDSETSLLQEWVLTPCQRETRAFLTVHCPLPKPCSAVSSIQLTMHGQFNGNCLLESDNMFPSSAYMPVFLCEFVCISPRSSHVLWVCACLVFVLEGKIASLLNAANTHLPRCAFNTQTQSAICLTGYQPPPAVCPTALH